MIRSGTPHPLHHDRARGAARRGFSLVEAVVAAGIVALMLVASINLLGGAVRNRAADNDHRTALMLGQQLMSEIQQQPYKDETLTGLLFGPELGENGSTRAGFDDVDDYADFQEKPPRLKDGTALSGYDNWKRAVKVTWVQPGSMANSLTDSGLERIEVEVTDPAGRATTVSALRSPYMNPDAPTSGTTALSWTGVEVDVGGQTPRRAAGGVNVITQPPAQ